MASAPGHAQGWLQGCRGPAAGIRSGPRWPRVRAGPCPPDRTPERTVARSSRRSPVATLTLSSAPRIRVVSGHAAGLRRNRNRGLAVAGGAGITGISQPELVACSAAGRLRHRTLPRMSGQSAQRQDDPQLTRPAWRRPVRLPPVTTVSWQAGEATADEPGTRQPGRIGNRTPGAFSDGVLAVIITIMAFEISDIVSGIESTEVVEGLVRPAGRGHGR
jgi:hypothetical protein